jgi:hypothetical protein
MTPPQAEPGPATLPTLQVFVISWKGMHGQACRMADALVQAGLEVVLVYSDPDHDFLPATLARTVRRSDDLFFGDKFQACLDHFSAQHMLLIHADCQCNDWVALAQRGLQVLSTMPKVWMWAPEIDYTGFGLERTRIMALAQSELVVAAHCDTIVFGIHQSVVKRLQKASLAENVYGWGVGWLAAAYAYAHQHCVVIDRSVQVKHPRTRSYDSKQANAQRDRYLQQLTFDEKVQSSLLGSHMALKDMQLARQAAAPLPERALS